MMSALHHLGSRVGPNVSLRNRDPCRWPHFGHTTSRKTGRRRKATSNILAGQTACPQLVGRRDTVYGSEGWGFESLRARPGQQPIAILQELLLLPKLLPK